MSDIVDVLLPVLVGGVIGIVGSFVGPFFLQRQKDAADKKRNRAEKCEELIGAVVEHFHWLTDWRSFTAYGQGTQPGLSPITKIQAITSTYFPELETSVQRFNFASNEHMKWALETGQKRLRKDPNFSTGFEDVANKYTAAQAELLEDLRSFARREFQ